MIKKSKISSNFTIFANDIITSSLSNQAKIMMQYLLSKPDDWKVRVADLRKSLNIGRNKTYNTIHELKQAGYMEHIMKHRKHGGVKSHDYDVYSEPQRRIIDKYADKKEPIIEAEIEVVTMSECAETTTYLGTVEGHEIIIQPGQTGLDVMLELTEKEELSEEATDNIAAFLAEKGFDPDECDVNDGKYTPSKKEEAANFEKIFLPKMFDMFWQAYPLKINKVKAKTAFIKAGKKHSIVKILEGLDNYIANKPDYQTWMHPTTFLNGERWNDEYRRPEQNIAKLNNNQSRGSRPEHMGIRVANRMLEIAKRRDCERFTNAHNYASPKLVLKGIL